MQDQSVSPGNGDFPNLFRCLPKDKFSDYLQRSMQAVLSNLKIPYRSQDNQLHMTNFFNYIQDFAQSIEPGIKVYVGGDAFRGIVGYIYKKLYNDYVRSLQEGVEPAEEVKQQQVLATMTKIIEGASRKTRQKKDNLTAAKVFGINRDLCLVVKFPDGFVGDQEGVLNRIKAEANKVSQQAGYTEKNSFEGALLPQFDVKSYDQYGEQVQRTNGCVLDWVSVSVKDGSLLYPDTARAIVEDLWKGYIHFPQIIDTSHELATRLEFVIKSFSSLLETPFLCFAEEDKVRIIECIKSLYQNLKPSEGASQEEWARIISYQNIGRRFFNQILDSSRLGGAHDRFGRARWHYKRASISDPLELAIFELWGECGLHVALSTVENVNPDTRPKLKFDVLKNLGLLEDPKNYTQLYHGTDVNSMSRILRNGGLTSSYNLQQGKADYGDGFYTAWDGQREISEGFGKGERGFVFDFGLKQSANVRIVDKNKLNQAKRDGKLPSGFSIEQNNVDVLVVKAGDGSRYPLIQNWGVVDFGSQDPIALLRNEMLIRIELTPYSSTERDPLSLIEDSRYNILSLVDADSYRQTLMKLLLPYAGNDQAIATKISDVYRDFEKFLPKTNEDLRIKKDRQWIRSRALNVLVKTLQKNPSLELNDDILAKSITEASDLLKNLRTKNLTGAFIETLCQFKRSQEDVEKLLQIKQNDKNLTDSALNSPLSDEDWRSVANYLLTQETQDPDLQQKVGMLDSNNIPWPIREPILFGGFDLIHIKDLNDLAKPHYDTYTSDYSELLKLLSQKPKGEEIQDLLDLKKGNASLFNKRKASDLLVVYRKLGSDKMARWLDLIRKYPDLNSDFSEEGIAYLEQLQKTKPALFEREDMDSQVLDAYSELGKEKMPFWVVLVEANPRVSSNEINNLIEDLKIEKLELLCSKGNLPKNLLLKSFIQRIL